MDAKTEFRNDSGGIIGVVTIEPGGKEVGLPLQPDETIWLSEDERIATANAHKRDEDNPFINGHLTKITNAEDVKNRRPIGDDQEVAPDAEEQRQKAEEAAQRKRDEDEAQRKEEDARREAGQEAATAPKPPAPAPKPSQARQAPEETAAPQEAGGKAAQGSRAAGEEVGTPEAVPSS